MISPKNLIADFYMYEFLTSSDETIDSDLELEIQSQAMDFIEQLKEYLITILEYSIIREISHVWWETIQPDTMNPPTKKYMESIIDEDIYYILLDLSPEWIDTIDVKLYEGEDLKGSPRLRHYMFIKNHTDIDTTTFISKFKKYFTKLAWVNDHGGENWDSITDSYLKLKQTKGKDLFIVCDSIFWLQHNTNTLFNKIKTWQENDSYDWINKFLDFRKECELWDLWEHCRESKKIAAKKLKLLYNKTKEQVKMKISDLEPKVINIGDPVGEIMTIGMGKIEKIVHTMDDIREYTNKPVFESIDSIKKMLKKELKNLEGQFNGKLDSIDENMTKYLTKLKTMSDELNTISGKLDIILNAQKDIKTSISNFQQAIQTSTDELYERISTYQNMVANFRQQVYDDMEQLHKTISKQQKDYVDQITKSLTEKFERELEEKTNAILEKLEQRWYKKLWKILCSIVKK